jgi:membrane associated rhomboid family serine protease
MFPLRDDVPSRRQPVVVWVLVLLNALVFVYESQLPEAGLRQFLGRFALTPALLTTPGGFAQHWMTLFTHMFLHGGWLHLIGNMWYLWIFGDNVSDRLGSPRFLLLYILGGLAAAGLQIHLNPAMQTPMVGASGAIAAVLGAYLVLYPKARVTTFIPIFIFIKLVDVPAVAWLGLWFVQQYFLGLGSVPGGMVAGGVAYWAHVGGFLFGIVAGLGARALEARGGTAAHDVSPARAMGRPRRDGGAWPF